MLRRRLVLAAAALAVFAGGVLAGRYLAPGRTVESERIVTSERDTALAFRAYVGTTTTTARRELAYRIVRARAWLPAGGSTETTTVEAVDRSASTSTTAAKQVVREEARRELDVSLARAKETAAAPVWLALVRGGLRLDDGGRVYGVELARRFGPVWASGWLSAAGLARRGAAAGLGLGFGF